MCLTVIVNPKNAISDTDNTLTKIDMLLFSKRKIYISCQRIYVRKVSTCDENYVRREMFPAIFQCDFLPVQV